MDLDQIEVDEFDSNQISSNIQPILIADLNNLIQIKIESIDFDFEEDNSNLFTLDKQLNLLMSNPKQKILDREVICQEDKLEQDCILSLKLLLNKNTKLTLPIKINDLNDQKPFFYQKEIQIDLNSIMDQQQQLTIPLKLAHDLDSSKKNRILNYTLIHKSTLLPIKLEYQNQSLNLLVNTAMLPNTFDETFYLIASDLNFTTEQIIKVKFKSQIKFEFFEKNFFNFTLTSSSDVKRVRVKNVSNQCDSEDLKFEFLNLTSVSAYNITIVKHLNELSISFDRLTAEVLPSEQQFKLIASCVSSNLNDVALVIVNHARNTAISINVISALNQVDLQSNSNNNFEMKFKEAPNDESITSSNNSSLTLAYLIINEPKFKVKPEYKIKMNQYLNNEMITNRDLFHLNQMRNGLYSIRVDNHDFEDLSQSQRHENDQKYCLKIEFLISQVSSDFQEETRYLYVKLDSTNRFISSMYNKSVLRVIAAQESDPLLLTTLSVESTVTDNLDLFNSVVIISTASIVLVIFGLVCFIVSISLYITSKCRMKSTNTNDDVKTKINSLYSSSSSTSTSSIKSRDNEIVVNTPQTLSSNSSSIRSIVKMPQLTVCSSSSDSSSCSNSNSDLMPSSSRDHHATTINTKNVKQRFKDHPTSNIMVYDQMIPKPCMDATSTTSSHFANNISPQTMTTVTSSSSSTCSDLPVQKQKYPQHGPLFDTHLSPEQDTIKSIQSTDNSSSKDHYDQYRNEIYRNSHLIILKQQQQQSSIFNSNNLNIYEAKPIQFNSNPFFNSPNSTKQPNTNPSSSTTNTQQISCV